MIRTNVPKLAVNGGIIEASRVQAELLRDAAAARAAASSQLRDLSPMLNRALRDERVLALRRSEARALRKLLQSEPDAELAPLRYALSESLGEPG
jgi:hypothetical protein